MQSHQFYAVYKNSLFLKLLLLSKKLFGKRLFFSFLQTAIVILENCFLGRINVWLANFKTLEVLNNQMIVRRFAKVAAKLVSQYNWPQLGFPQFSKLHYSVWLGSYLGSWFTTTEMFRAVSHLATKLKSKSNIAYLLLSENRLRWSILMIWLLCRIVFTIISWAKRTPF